MGIPAGRRGVKDEEEEKRENEEEEIFLAHHYSRKWSASYQRCLLVNTRTFTQRVTSASPIIHATEKLIPLACHSARRTVSPGLVFEDSSAHIHAAHGRALHVRSRVGNVTNTFETEENTFPPY